MAPNTLAGLKQAAGNPDVEDNYATLHDPEGMWQDLHSINPQWNAYMRVLQARGVSGFGADKFAPKGGSLAADNVNIPGVVDPTAFASHILSNEIDPSAATYGMGSGSAHTLGAAMKGLLKAQS
jgi:hypothetical protein